MTPGQDKLRSLGRRLDLQQKCLNTVSALEGLPRYLFFRRKKSFCLSKINNIIPAFMPQYYSVDNLSLPVYEILVHCIPFSFSDLLKNNLLCCLRSYSAKITCIDPDLGSISTCMLSATPKRFFAADKRAAFTASSIIAPLIPFSLLICSITFISSLLIENRFLPFKKKVGITTAHSISRA